MKPIRFRQWGSALLAPGIIRRSDLHHHPCPRLVLRACGYSIIQTRLQSTAQLLATPPPTSEADTAAVVKPKKRGRKKAIPPPSPSTIISSSSASSSSLSSQSSDEPLVWQYGQSDVSPKQEPAKPPQRRADVTESTFKKEKLPSPPVNTPSPKLSALHARLSLSSRIPIQTFARCLVDATADPDHRFNNTLLARLGRQLLEYYLSEYLICNYPRLPMSILASAMDAYIGPTAMQGLVQDWGVEIAAEPGGEVDPGLLQFRMDFPSEGVKDEVIKSLRRFAETRVAQTMRRRARKEEDDRREAGDVLDHLTVTVEQASRSFVRAVFGAIYLHCGAAATQEFLKAHVLSRHLDLGSIFTFKHPTRDLSRLCAREGFEPPVARLISETGRLSRHPVFVVGIFSGRDKIGEDAGASLDEARFRAAMNALRGWYLYSPKTENGEIMLPSMMIGHTDASTRTWQPVHVDDGEVII